MWASGAVSDEDRLDRAETGRVLRRSLQFAQPYKRTIYWAIGLVCASTAAVVAGPVFVKFGLDHGIGDSSARALNIAVIGYLATVVIGYVVGRLQDLAINRAGEGFLRDLRVTVFDKLQAQSINSVRIKQVMLTFSTPLIFATEFKLSVSSLIWSQRIRSCMTSRNLLSDLI